jgi:hypothetical protein
MASKMISKKSSKKKSTKGNQLDVIRPYYGKPLSKGISSLNGNLIGFPDRLRVKLKWDDEYSFTGSAFTGNVFRGNSVYDPDFTGTFSNTPAYYTSLKAVYGQYCVLGAKIKAQFNNEASVGGEGVLWASDQNIGSLTFQQMAESKRSKVAEYGPLTGVGKSTLNMSCSSEEMQGQEHLENDPSNYSSMTNNPSDAWYFGIFVRSLDASNVNVYCRVTIEMDVVLKELIAQTS